MKSMKEDIVIIRRDMEFIKEILLSERQELELTDWARKELEEARERKKKISHEEVKNMILSRQCPSGRLTKNF